MPVWSSGIIHIQIAFYQVRQGRTWSRNYKSPSPPPSPTRLKNFSQLSISIQFTKLHPIFKETFIFQFTFNFQNYIQFLKKHLVFKITYNFQNYF
jgi:hypothetical protein